MLAGPARAGGPEELRQGTGHRPAWVKRGSWSRVAIGSGPVRAGLAWARPEWGDVMPKGPPGRVAVGRAERRGRDKVVKLGWNPGRDPSREPGRDLKRRVAGLRGR